MKKPVFNVYMQKFNNEIESVNFFEFGQWEVIKRELKKYNKILTKMYDKYLDEGGVDFDTKPLKKEFDELVKNEFWNKKIKFNVDTFIEDFLDEKLRSQCMYYFWSKCEYEIVLKEWVGPSCEKKIDVYEQLINNWELFKMVVFKVIGV